MGTARILDFVDGVWDEEDWGGRGLLVCDSRGSRSSKCFERRNELEYEDERVLVVGGWLHGDVVHVLVALCRCLLQTERMMGNLL